MEQQKTSIHQTTNNEQQQQNISYQNARIFVRIGKQCSQNQCSKRIFILIILTETLF